MSRTLPLVYVVYDVKTIQSEGERLAYLKNEKFDPLKEAVIETGTSGLALRPELFVSPVKILSKEDTEITAEAEALADGVLVFHSVFYPRWKAEVDGRMETVIPVNHAFSGVFLKKGRHRVRG